MIVSDLIKDSFKKFRHVYWYNSCRQLMSYNKSSPMYIFNDMNLLIITNSYCILISNCSFDLADEISFFQFSGSLNCGPGDTIPRFTCLPHTFYLYYTTTLVSNKQKLLTVYNYFMLIVCHCRVFPQTTKLALLIQSSKCLLATNYVKLPSSHV